MTITAATTLPEFTVARAEGQTALYKRPTPHHDWTLVMVEQGDAAAALTALEATGANINTLDEALHLLVGGAFPATLTTFASPTAVAMLRAEAGLLRKRAQTKRTEAAFAGEYGDRGATGLEKIAEAYEHAIHIFETYPR